MIVLIIFGIALVATTLLAILLLATLLSESVQVWPPPNVESWQYRIFWTLFRVMIIGIILLSVLDFNSMLMFQSKWRYFVGIPLALLGFGLATHISFALGWKNAHGEQEGLKTDGWYRISRNPVYVVSIIGMAGLGLTVNSGYVYVLLLLWGLFYLVAPVLEEPWLEEAYGESYLKYKSQTPRFI